MARKRLMNAQYVGKEDAFRGPTLDTQGVRIEIKDDKVDDVQLAAKDIPESVRGALAVAGFWLLASNLKNTVEGGIAKQAEAIRELAAGIVKGKLPQARTVGGAGPSGGLTKTAEVLALTGDFATAEEAQDLIDHAKESMPKEDYNKLMRGLRSTQEYKDAEREWEASHAKADAPKLSDLLGTAKAATKAKGKGEAKAS